VVKKPGMQITREELLRAYDGHVAKWWVPDDVVFVDALPIGATGKVMKNVIREQFREHKLLSA
jgi:3-(methylthio)propionyl---CoA ligase